MERKKSFGLHFTLLTNYNYSYWNFCQSLVIDDCSVFVIDYLSMKDEIKIAKCCIK